MKKTFEDIHQQLNLHLTIHRNEYLIEAKMRILHQEHFLQVIYKYLVRLYLYFEQD